MGKRHADPGSRHQHPNQRCVLRQRRLPGPRYLRRPPPGRLPGGDEGQLPPRKLREWPRRGSQGRRGYGVGRATGRGAGSREPQHRYRLRRARRGCCGCGGGCLAAAKAEADGHCEAAVLRTFHPLLRALAAPGCPGYPRQLAELPAGECGAAIAVDHDPRRVFESQQPGRGPGAHAHQR